ncbi:MAG: UvrD-helicase domain-containing protein [Chitinophagaceae bacterium]
MQYFGITFKTIEWLLANTTLLETFKKDLRYSLGKSLAEGVLTAGSMRLTASDSVLLCVWNNDYLSGTDTEEWGFVKINGKFGLLETESIYEEALERCLNLVSLRLQGFNLPDDRYIHRVKGENLHTSLAGRGDQARKYTLGWYEDKVHTSKGAFHSLLIAGPSNEQVQSLSNLINTLENLKPTLAKLVDNANDLLVRARSRPILESDLFSEFRNRSIEQASEEGILNIDKQLGENTFDDDKRYTTYDWNYSQWIDDTSPLTSVQRDILKSDIILEQPLRIIGAAGTGKSLLMQLLVLRRLEDAREKDLATSIFYIVHNNEIANSIKLRFSTLGADKYLDLSGSQRLVVKTLFQYACEVLKLDDSILIDKDASQTKMYQRLVVLESMEEVLRNRPKFIDESHLIKRVSEDGGLRDVFADIVVSEIGVGIKGRDLSNDRRRYIESERPLTRFHGSLNEFERRFVFEIFLRYNSWVADGNGMMDADDVAITLLGVLKTPLWDLKRKKQAFDFVFIDETQLFNQNERQLFKFLTKRASSNLPIVIALDEAQEIRNSSSAGFGALGIEHLANETLPNVHRSTKEILNLSFFIIQHTTDLFGTEFPDFTRSTTVGINNNNSNEVPKLVTSKMDLGSQVKKEISSLRKADVRQIAVIVHAERYMQEIISGLKRGNKENVIVAEKRGERIDPKRPIIYVARPDLVGGQEFDAVVAVGLEQGVVPPVLNGHMGLTEAMDQQALREMYLSFTRAKRYLSIVNSANSSPTSILQRALYEGILTKED